MFCIQRLQNEHLVKFEASSAWEQKQVFALHPCIFHVMLERTWFNTVCMIMHSAWEYDPTAPSWRPYDCTPVCEGVRQVLR